MPHHLQAPLVMQYRDIQAREFLESFISVTVLVASV
jgi:hypothetical protein